MATIVKLGPADQGKRFTLEEFMQADYVEGFRYELIDGRLEVSPSPEPPQGILEVWINFKLNLYAMAHPEVVNFVCPKARVFVPGRPGVTNPEPDAAAYRDFPLDSDFRDIHWQNLSPILVAEVVSENDPAKDLKRNVELYHQVPSIKEYWVFDPRDNPNYPTLKAMIRHGRRWRTVERAFGETYSTRLLPGFELLIDPRK